MLSRTDDAAYPAVVAIDVQLPTGEELCTGYSMAADLVLTARHSATASSGCTVGAGAADAPWLLSILALITARASRAWAQRRSRRRRSR